MLNLSPEGHILLDKGPVQLKPYKQREPIPYTLATDAEIVAGAGGDLISDTECYPNYFLAAFKIVKTGKIIQLENNFNPAMLSWILFNYRTVGFNSKNYDLMMMWASYVNRDTEYLNSVSNGIINQGLRGAELYKTFHFKPYETPHIDLIEVCPLKGSLKLYGGRLHSPRIQDLPFPDTKYLTAEEIEIVRNYNINDLDVTEQTFHFNKERLDLRATMGIEYKEDLMSKSDAQIAEAVLTREVKKLTGKWPKRPEIEPGTAYKYEVPSYIQYKTKELQKVLYDVRTADFIVNEHGKIILPESLKASVKLNNGIYRIGIGGLHSSEQNISHIENEEYAIIDRDVASYYPRIITNLKLYPQSMGPDFLTAYEQIIQTRLRAKKNKVFSTDKGLKIVINGTSGKFSDSWSKMYAPDLTIQVTVTGQLALLMLIESIELNDISVISANTDGIVIFCRRDKITRLNEIIKDWEIKTNFETEETLYKGYYARDVNAYFAIKKDAKSVKDVKVKGPYSEVGSQSGTQLDNNPINLICSDAIKQLLVDGTPIEKTIRTCKDLTRFITLRQVKGGAHKDREYLGKVVRYYYARNIQGTINYVINGNKVADTEGAKPCMDMPTIFPEDIDYEKYIQIATEILYDIDYLKRPKQITFF